MHNAAAFLRIKFAEGTSHDGRSLRATAPFPNMMPLRILIMEDADFRRVVDGLFKFVLDFLARFAVEFADDVDGDE